MSASPAVFGGVLMAARPEKRQARRQQQCEAETKSKAKRSRDGGLPPIPPGSRKRRSMQVSVAIPNLRNDADRGRSSSDSAAL